MKNQLNFIIYGNEYCHLCHNMLEDLNYFCKYYNLYYHIDFIDLDNLQDLNPTLYETYELKIPVLLLDNQEVCHYFLDVEKLTHLLQII